MCTVHTVIHGDRTALILPVPHDPTYARTHVHTSTPFPFHLGTRKMEHTTPVKDSLWAGKPLLPRGKLLPRVVWRTSRSSLWKQSQTKTPTLSTSTASQLPTSGLT